MRDEENMYGKKNLIAVGGNTEAAEPRAEKKTEATMVSVTYNPMPYDWHDELTHMFPSG